MKLLVGLKPNLIMENSTPNTKIQLDELDMIENSIDTNLEKDARITPEILDSFQLKDTLNQDIWPNGKIDDEVRVRLIEIAEDFIKDLNIPSELVVKDIIFTGSLANYNWSRYSDIDLHIVMDFNQFDLDPKLTNDYFYVQKTIWNQEHDITLKGFPVEIYVQNINKELIATAVYSVLKNKWIKKPKREEFTIDKKAIKTKANSFIYQLRDIKQDYLDKQYDLVVDKVTKLKKKIKQMRNAGLERGGEFSLENMVFKVLRRTDFMDILDSYKAKSYDKNLSIDEAKSPDSQKWGAILFIKGKPLSDGSQRLYVTTVKNILSLDRKKKDDSNGEPARMAILGNQIFRVTVRDGKLMAVGVDWRSTSSMLDILGLSKSSVAINNNKTPLHWETLNSNNVNQVFKSIEAPIRNLPNIRWVG
jgi:hypothetical protein